MRIHRVVLIGRKALFMIFLFIPAGVAEWQTRRTQNPLPARACGFDSLLRHQLEFVLQIAYDPQIRFPPRNCFF